MESDAQVPSQQKEESAPDEPQKDPENSQANGLNEEQKEQEEAKDCEA